jgi:hypothetical protein
MNTTTRIEARVVETISIYLLILQKLIEAAGKTNWLKKRDEVVCRGREKWKPTGLLLRAL